MANQNRCRQLAAEFGAAKHFRPLQVIKGVELVWKIETGFRCCPWLQRKLRNTVLMQHHDKRRAASEIVVAYSRGRTFLAFA
jgi:hypothetical protein